MSAYYNEHDPAAAAWLRELIAAGLIAQGDVDDRSIEDVKPGDLRGYQQCHFFAGIGGWSYALRLAGWPDDLSVWTGSCPCQPFSEAGKGAGFEDERHLWPAWHHLIQQCRPAVIFGEQVASAAAGPWIDLVHADMEAMGHAFGCVPFAAAGVGAPHLRERAYWVAYANSSFTRVGRIAGGQEGARVSRWAIADGRSNAVGLADSQRGRRREERAHDGGCSVGDSTQEFTAGLEHGGGHLRGSPLHSFWRDADWLRCRDGRWRPVEPGTFPLAHGLPARVGRLRGYGNAIVPQQAAEFITAFVECSLMEAA